MTKPIIAIHNADTGEVIEREMTDAEFAQHQIDQAIVVARVAEKETKKVERQALFDRLGLTEEEAKLILG